MGGAPTDKIRATVTISGREYTLTTYDTESYVRRVASYIDRKMTEIAVTTRLPKEQVAVLTAVGIADDLFKAKDELTRLRRELEKLRETRA